MRRWMHYARSCAGIRCSACCWTKTRTLSSLPYGRSRSSSAYFPQRIKRRQRKHKRDSLSVWQTNSPSTASMLPSTCSIRVRQIWKMEWLFTMRCSAPSVPPGAHGVTTKSVLTAMHCTSMTSAPSTRPFRILSGSAYPSWNTTVRRSMRRRSTVSTMMIVSRRS